MRKFFLLIIFATIFSCKGDHVDKPKNLIDKNLMSKVMVDVMINEQIATLVAGNDFHAGTKTAIEKNGIKVADFVESYKYYVAIGEMNSIIKEAQSKLLEADPKANEYLKDTIQKRVDEPQNIPEPRQEQAPLQKLEVQLREDGTLRR